MNKEILIISNYFPPETGAASNRIYTLADTLAKNNYKVSVICPLPNYPFGKVFKEYKGKFIHKSFENNIKIFRLWLFASNSRNKFIRLFSMLSFAISLFLFLLFSKTPRKVIIQCSPLFVGFSGVLASKIKRKKIILNVSDLWPLAGLEMGILNKGFYYSILEKIELFNYKNSNLLLGQSQEILNHFKQLVPNKPSFLYRNYPDFELPEDIQLSESNNVKIVYAGLLGVAQGIHNICKEVTLPKNVELHIYGNGPEADLVTQISNEKENIFYHNSIERSELHKTLLTYDITLIPLINRIYGSVPSKIFEFSKLGLPILYFSDGEGRDLVEQHELGIAFSVTDFNGLNTYLQNLSVNKSILPSKEKIKTTVNTVFNFEKQFEDFLRTLDQV